MEEHPELVTGAFQKMGARKSSNELWAQLVSNLNSKGPPVRDEDAWKKV